MISEKYISVAAASAASGIAEESLRRAARQGKIKAREIGRDWLVETSQLVNLAAAWALTRPPSALVPATVALLRPLILAVVVLAMVFGWRWTTVRFTSGSFVISDPAATVVAGRLVPAFDEVRDDLEKLFDWAHWVLLRVGDRLFYYRLRIT